MEPGDKTWVRRERGIDEWGSETRVQVTAPDYDRRGSDALHLNLAEVVAGDGKALAVRGEARIPKAMVEAT